VIGHNTDAQPLLDAAGVKKDVGIMEVGQGTDAFLEAAKNGRVWAREPEVRPHG